MAARKRILIADDEKELALAIKVRLEAAGYQVTTAHDGREALELAKQDRPDLILLDVLMPVMDGYACLRQLNAHYGHGAIPVIVLTVRDYMKDLFALEGIEDYMIKPFDHEDLLLRMDRIFRRRAERASSSSP
ncbi:MAG TPA: response regulator [bacterium]